MNKRRTAQVFIIGVLAFSLVLPAHAKSIDNAKSSKEELQKKRDKTNKQIDNLESDKDDIQASIEKLDEKLAQMNQKIETLSEQLSKTNEKLVKTKSNLKQAQKKEKEQYATMKERIKFMYENGETAYIDAIFQASSMGELLNRAEYISKISEYDHNMLVRFEETRKEIADTKTQLEEQAAKVKSLKIKVEDQQTSVEQVVEEKSVQVKKYEATIKSKKSLVAEYEKGIADQEALIAKLEKEAIERAKKEAEEAARKKAAERAAQNSNNDSIETPSISVPQYSGGKFTWPCPSSYRITSSYGYRVHPITGTKKLHNGVDIGASAGSSVVAAADGTVILAAYSSSAGNWIIIDHGGGISTVYMHNSSLSVSSGTTVKKGQHIANVGSTGMSTGSHLHFGVRVNGSYVNPMSYLQ